MSDRDRTAPDAMSADHARERDPGEVPLLGYLKFGPIRFEPGRGRIELTVLPEHLRTLGVAHGGLLATLLDSALGMTASTRAPAGHFVVTVQLNINFIRPAWLDEKLIAVADLQHAGRSTAVARGEVRTDGGALVASATGTFMYLPMPADPAAGLRRNPS